MRSVWRLGTNWGGIDIFDMVLSSRVGFYCNGSESVSVGDYVAVAAFHSYEVAAVGIVSSQVLPLDELLTEEEKEGVLKPWIGEAKGFRFSLLARLDDSDMFRTKNYLQFYSLANDSDAREKTVAAIEKIKGEVMVRNLFNLIKVCFSVVLTGAPGTGKTYIARQLARRITKGIDKNVLNVQFHPSYGYSDFVEGLRPVKKTGADEIGFERRDGVFMELCRKAREHQDEDYAVIIDEINRGDISKIFGELFSLIEPDYRSCDGKDKNGNFVAVKTQYANLMSDDDVFKAGFFVPPNVYIIGTMNDVDRSVESMDFAIRRRFVWHEIKPGDRFDAMWGCDVDGVDKEDVKSRMNDINKKIKNDPALGDAYQIGPAYFVKLKELKGDYQLLWEQRLELLLKEYLRGMPDAQAKLKELHSILVNTTESENA